MAAATITSKGQITIPAKVRTALGLVLETGLNSSKPKKGSSRSSLPLVRYEN